MYETLILYALKLLVNLSLRDLHYRSNSAFRIVQTAEFFDNSIGTKFEIGVSFFDSCDLAELIYTVDENCAEEEMKSNTEGKTEVLSQLWYNLFFFNLKRLSSHSHGFA